MQFIYADISRGGLGNKLLIWTRAYAFSKKHSLELVTSSWYTLSLGPFLRSERRKRLYWDYFKNDKIAKQIKYFVLKPFCKIVYDPSFDELETLRCIYVFRNPSITSDYFYDLKPYRLEIKDFIFNMLNSNLLSIFKSFNKPVIGIHIRRGDFKSGSTVTPEKYFYDCILSIRQYANIDLPVTVFSDEYPDKLQMLQSLKNISFFNSEADILDILLLASSKLAILSISSTFSFWGAFLSDGVILKHPMEWHPDIRPKNINNIYYENIYDPYLPMNPSLKKAIDKIIHETKA